MGCQNSSTSVCEQYSTKRPVMGSPLLLCTNIIHLATAELYAKNAVLADRPGFLSLQKKHRFDPRGRYLVDSRALTESLRKLSRAKPTNAEVHTSNDQDAVDPWEDEWFETTREEVHAAMPTLSTEELTAAIEKHNVMRVDQYRWAGAGITAAGPQEHIWGDSILKTSGSDERAAKRARKDERLAALARNEVIAAQGAAKHAPMAGLLGLRGDDRGRVA